ncbi:MAG: hypothetical protein Q8K85_01600 [Hyphomicrobium sp.]|nr:hypothetical protein [Hyphomicrobium sp.]
MAERDLESAHSRVDAHEGVCAERYGNINQQLITLHERLNAMSNRMWAAAAGLILLSIGGLAALLMIVITRK